MPNIDHLNLGQCRGGEIEVFIFIRHFDTTYSIQYQLPVCVVVNTFAFCIGERGLISSMDKLLFKKTFYPSTPSGVTNSLFVKFYIIGKISKLQRKRGKGHKSYKEASIKAYLLIQGPSFCFPNIARLVSRARQVKVIKEWKNIMSLLICTMQSMYQTS